jgi:hypothetical protein
MNNHLTTAHEHISLDLYYQALKTSHELDNVITHLSTRKEAIDLTLHRFQDIFKLDKNEIPNIDMFLLPNGTDQTKQQIKHYKKYLKKIS